MGVLSLLGVLCYRYPSYLTTAELRASYDADVLQQVLMWGMFASLIFALLTFILGKRRRLGAIGVLFIAAAYALGGYTIETGPVEPSPLAFGLDWLILAFVDRCLVMVPLYLLGTTKRLPRTWGGQFLYPFR